MGPLWKVLCPNVKDEQTQQFSQLPPKPHTHKRQGWDLNPITSSLFRRFQKLFWTLKACQSLGLRRTGSVLFLPQMCVLPSVRRSTVYWACLWKLILKIRWAEPRGGNGSPQRNEGTEPGFLFSLVSVLLMYMSHDPCPHVAGSWPSLRTWATDSPEP